MNKKLFSLLAALLLAAAGYAQRGTTGGLHWSLNNGTLTINGIGAMPNYSSNPPWSNYISSIKSVVIGRYVTSIGNFAFIICSNLSSVTIPNSVTSIGSAAFTDCGSLSSVTIPGSVTSIGSAAFAGCISLTSIEVAESNPNYASQDGVLFSKDKSTLVHYPAGKTGAYAIPSSVDTIGIFAFRHCSSLSSVIIPNSVTSIGSSAFINCSGLTEVVALNPQPVAIATNVFSGINKSSCALKVSTGSVSLYKTAAGWQDFTNIEGITTYTVTFNAKEGSSVTPQVIKSGSAATLPAAPTRANYTFGGWYREADCSNKRDFAANMVTSNTTLYAKWTINSYTVIFNAQEGSNVVPQAVEHGSTATLPAAPIRTGYTFGGWYKEADCANEWNFATDMITCDTTFYAQWTINSYAVMFNAQNGSSVTPQVVKHGSKATQPTAPTRIGYTFGGWYREADCANEWNFATNMITYHTTLYAKWIIKTTP